MNIKYINMKNKFKEDVTYCIKYNEIISNEIVGQNIKAGTPLYHFTIERIGKELKVETVDVMKEYVDYIGIDNYIYNNIGNWSINYENDIEKLEKTA